MIIYLIISIIINLL